MHEENTINWFGFMGHLREPMGPLRRQLVEDIFNQIDEEAAGAVPATKVSKH